MPVKLILENRQSPGDILMLTAAVRDLHATHPGKYITDVRTTSIEIWDNNPYITPIPDGEEDIRLPCKYSIINKSNDIPYHFVHGFRKYIEPKLGIRIEQGACKGEIYYSEDELRSTNPFGQPFWILVDGGKFDYTAKWANPDTYQKVLNHFRGKMMFVQCGSFNHFHLPYAGNNVINMIGKTDLRQFINLMYHACGVLCPVTFAMHLAAAAKSKYGLTNRPCVVLAGGREPAHWVSYSAHRFLTNVGALPCCMHGGCWRSRCTKVGDGDPKDVENLCEYPVKTNYKILLNNGQDKLPQETDVYVPKCMDMIKPHHIIEAIESYMEGGVLQYAK